MSDRVGQRLDNYRLVRLLGIGSFGAVYLAEHMYRKTLVAIKVLQPLSDNDLQGFLNEARTMRLKHPHIVEVLDFGVDNQVPFIVMDYAPHGTLRQRHPRGTRVPLVTVILYVKQIASALQYAHDERMIHRDVKPENLLMGANNEVLVSDFGIATVAHSSRSRNTQEMAGTVVYMAPEQIQGKPQFASDQYALGVIVYEWLCGEPPFSGTPIEIATQHMLTPPPPLHEKVSGIPADVERVVMTTLAKNPKERFASMQAFATALEQASLSSQQATRAPLPSSPWVPPPFPTSQVMDGRRRLNSRRVVIGGLIGLAATGTGIGLLALLGGLHFPIGFFATSSSNTPPGISSDPTVIRTKIQSDGLKSFSLLQWGADYVGGAPYVFQDPTNPGKLVGFEVEIAQAIADLMGIQQKQIEICYANLEQALQANQIDMVMNGWEKTADREKTELFSDPYYRYGQQIIVRKDDTRFANVDPKDVSVLEGYTVGTGSGYKAEAIMKADPNITIKSYTGNIAFSDLVQKKVDALFLDYPLASYYILGTGPGVTAITQLKLLGRPLYLDNYYVGFNKSNSNAAKLLPEINQAFATLKNNGTLKKIYVKWQLMNDDQKDIGVL